MKERCCISLIVSLIAIALSVIALIRSCPNTNMSFDYMGVIVGILSLLVTVLIGWNIFYALNINGRVDKMQNDLKRHSYLNQKEFNKIKETLIRADAFSKNLDKTLEEFMTIVRKGNNSKDE